MNETKTSEHALESFEKLLIEHDWTYEYSDDSRVYNEGQRKEDRIKQEARKSPLLKKFYTAYYKALCNGETRPTAQSFMEVNND